MTSLGGMLGGSAMQEFTSIKKEKQMIKNLLIAIISIIGIGCQKPEPIEIKSIIGEFYSIGNSEDFSHLELREDKTYHFDQAKNHSCDIWGHFYGNWEVDRNRLILFKGTNLDSIIEVTRNRNLKSDTLTISFSDEFLKEFPNLKVRIGLDSFDTEIINNQIIFDKDSYCNKEEIFKYATREKESTYQYYPLELNIRANNYHHTSHYILSEDKIRFGLGNFKRDENKLEKLIEYRLENGLLTSVSSSNWINHHKLEREREKLNNEEKRK